MMRLQTFLIVMFLTFYFAVHCPAIDIDLQKNCFAPEDAANLLRTLRTADWKELDRQKLQELWSAKFRISEDCEVQESGVVYPCSLASAGFCYDNICYCNVAFDLHRKPGAPEKLDSLTMFYSSGDLEQVITATQLFLSALAPLTEKHSFPNNGWRLDETKHLSKMYGYYPDYSYREGNTVHSGGDLGLQLKLYTLENGISSVYLTVSDPEENRPPNKSMQRTTPAPHNVTPLATRFRCSGERQKLIGYHILRRQQFHRRFYEHIEYPFYPRTRYPLPTNL